MRLAHRTITISEIKRGVAADLLFASSFSVKLTTSNWQCEHSLEKSIHTLPSS